MDKLHRDFFLRDTVTVARDLLGKHLVRITDDGQALCGRITETEAYVGPVDKACHAYGGRRTARTKTLYAQGGTAYLYLIYGMYHCMNFVTEAEGTPCAVLLRGLEVIDGGERMAQNRFARPLSALSTQQKKGFLNGPGKVCQALELTRAQNGLDCCGDTLFLLDAGVCNREIQIGKRIGIPYAEEAIDFPWRFWI